jgi:adenosylhomocysteinase
MSSTVANPPKRVARALIRSLHTGTSVLEGVKYLHVGHSGWLSAQAELLDELAEDADSDVVFVRGSYGAGKTHFLACVQDRALDANWATAHLECRRDQVQLDRLETVYARVLYKLRSKEMLDDAARSGQDLGSFDGARWFLTRWANEVLKKAGFVNGPIRRTMEVDERLCGILERGLMKSNLPEDFKRALFAFSRAFLLNQNDVCSAIIAWLKGSDERVFLPRSLLQAARRAGIVPSGSKSEQVIVLNPVGRATSTEYLRAIVWLIRATGHLGLVLCIDEVEECAKLSPKKRQDQAFQTLREFIDNSDGELGLRHLCTYFAATPEMFEGEQYFRRYDALASRIEPVGDEVNWRSPVVDLDRTPLSFGEFRALAHKVRWMHGLAHDWNVSKVFTDDILDELLAAVQRARYRIAKPRLLCRVLAHELDRSRSQGPKYSLQMRQDQLVEKAAQEIQAEESV